MRLRDRSPDEMLRIGLFGVVLAASALLAGCGGGMASPSKVAVAVGATACDDSGLYVRPIIYPSSTSTRHIRGAREEVYDCVFPHRLPECVVYERKDNLATATAVKGPFVFSPASARRFSCFRQRRIVQARRAARRIARRQKVAVASSSNRLFSIFPRAPSQRRCVILERRSPRKARPGLCQTSVRRAQTHEPAWIVTFTERWGQAASCSPHCRLIARGFTHPAASSFRWRHTWRISVGGPNLRVLGNRSSGAAVPQHHA